MAEVAGCKAHPAGVGERIVADAEVRKSFGASCSRSRNARSRSKLPRPHQLCIPAFLLRDSPDRDLAFVRINRTGVGSLPIERNTAHEELAYVQHLNFCKSCGAIWRIRQVASRSRPPRRKTRPRALCLRLHSVRRRQMRSGRSWCMKQR